MGAGTVEDVAGVTVAREHVGQGRRVAEGVHVVAHLRAHPETVLEIALAVQDLAVQSHDRREVNVGLDVLPPRDVPPAALDEAPHALEEVGVDPLHLLVEPRLPAGEDELGVLVAAIRGRTERGQRLVHPRLPGPQPHRVDVGVSYHVDYHEKTNPLGLPTLAFPNYRRRTETARTDVLPRLALDGSGREGADDEPLQDDEGGDGRQHSQYPSRGDYLGGGHGVIALEVEDADRDREQRGFAEEYVGHDELSPGEDRREHEDRGEPRQDERQGNPP